MQGDGFSNVAELVEQRLHGPQGSAFGADARLTKSCLEFQGLHADAIPEAGRSFWIDFRYGRTFRPPGASSKAPNRLPELQQRCGAELAAAQSAVARALQQTVSAPVVSSIDAVLDVEDRLWWLELNSNPLLPHHGYEIMLNELFSRNAPAMPEANMASRGSAT